MNYRHIYHAGNFADVVKHIIVCRILHHLKLKPTPFRAIDTHAGIGLYDLARNEAMRTGEAQAGIGRVWKHAFSTSTRDLLAPYLECIDALEREARVKLDTKQGSLPLVYPGSPLLMRKLMRTSDRLVVNELHPDDYQALRKQFAKDRQVKVLQLDGWIALKSLLPVPERRGVILIDPPFEEPGEFERLVAGLKAGTQRFANGIFVLWHPIKNPTDIKNFHKELRALNLPKMLAVDFMRQGVRRRDELNGSGVVVLNPPYRLHDELGQILPELTGPLGAGPGVGFQQKWLGEP